MTRLHGLPARRPPRPRRDTFSEPSFGEMLEAIANWRDLERVAAAFPDWEPGGNGRPPDFPAVVYCVLRMLAYHVGSIRRMLREVNGPAHREALQRVFGATYSTYPGFQKRKPVTRWHIIRFQRRYKDWEAVMQRAYDAAMECAAAQAVCMGLMTAESGGSLTNPVRARIVSGDGLVLRGIYKTKFGDEVVDPLTGEIIQRRFDADAAEFLTGTGRAIGTKWQHWSASTGHEYEQVVLSLRNQSSRAEGGEAAVATSSLLDVAQRLPGILGYSYDKAIRGTHIETLYATGLLPVVKVHRRDGAARLQVLGRAPVRCSDGVSEDVDVFTVAGHGCLRVVVNGEHEFVEMTRKKVQHGRRRNGVRWYLTYEVPDDPRVPARLRGGHVTARLNQTAADDDAGRNRAEMIRPFTEADPDWSELYYDRPGTESLNEWMQSRLPKRRAPSMGVAAQKLDLLFLMLYKNLLAKLAFEARTGTPATGPPEHVDLAA